jgi:flavin-binding protein dodecin
VYISPRHAVAPVRTITQSAAAEERYASASCQASSLFAIVDGKGAVTSGGKDSYSWTLQMGFLEDSPDLKLITAFVRSLVAHGTATQISAYTLASGAMKCVEIFGALDVHHALHRFLRC